MIGPDSEEVLLELLSNDNPEIREQSARSLGDIKPSLHSSIPKLLETLNNDQEIKVRQAAAISLGKIGAVGEQAIISICSSLESKDQLQISSAFQAIKSIGPIADCAIPKLIKIISRDDSIIREEAIKTIGIFGKDAAGVVPDLIKIIDDRNLYIMSSTIRSLGDIGPAASQAVPSLIKLLDERIEPYVDETIRTLGKIGYQSYPAIPALINILEQPGNNYKEATVETLVIIATDARDSGSVALIDDVRIILNALNRHPELSTPKYEKGEHIKTVARSLEFLELSIKDSILDRIITIQKNLPWGIKAIEILIIIYIIWVVILYIIVLFAPFLITKLHNSLSGIEIGVKHGFIQTKMPVRRFLYLNNLLGKRRVLNSWIRHHISNARQNFQNKQTVKQRETHVDLPVSVNGEIKEFLRATDIKSLVKTDIFSILIHGEGGSGKTHLACHIAKWCMNRNKELNLFKHLSIPIIIEDDIPNSDNPQEAIMSTISGQLRQIVGSPNKIPYPLLIRLIESKRVLVIVDHFSEMTESTVTTLKNLFETSVINALIVTSRIDEKLGDSSVIKLNPHRLKKGHLRHFFDAYLRKRNQIDLFGDLEFGNLLDRLSNLVGDRDITVLLCKLYAEQLIAFKNGQIEDLPKNIPELILQYLNELNRNVATNRIEDRLVHNHAKKIAWFSVEQYFKSSYVSIDSIINRLDTEDPENVVTYFKERIRIIKTIEPAKDKVKFVLDPISEYLAGIFIVETYGESDWFNLIDKFEIMKDDLNKAQGFIFALLDCCKANLTDAIIPDGVIESIQKRFINV